jgi:uncharacterized protein involved in outer membrane biogenesis
MDHGSPKFKYRSWLPPLGRLSRPSIWAGGAALAMTILLGIALSITDWNFARGNIESLLSSRLHRDVRIAGPLTASLLSTRPRVHVAGVTIANPEWAGSRNLAEIAQIDIEVSLRALLRGDWVLETLVVDEPVVALIRDRNGRANFDFADSSGATHNTNREARGDHQAPHLPVVRRLTLRGGRLYVRDEVHKLIFEGQVEASEQLSRRGDEPFRLHGEGALNGEPFTLRFNGGPLANLRMEEPYAFQLKMTAGKTHGSADGVFAQPFDFATVSAMVHIDGENLAHLYYLTGLALPFTPPYRLSGQLQTARQEVAMQGLDGKIGASDLNGDLSVDLAPERPKLMATLHSQSLNLADLSPALGKGVRTDSEGDALDGVAPAPLPPDKLFPTYRFRFDRLRTMDAEVALHAASVQTERTPFQQVSIHLRLDDAVLRLDPVIMTLPQGRLTGAIKIDARAPVARTDLDLHIENVDLAQFRGKNTPEPPLAGILHARMNIAGTGNSVHDILATADGQAQAVIPHGEVRKAFAELTGVNVARGLGLLLAKDKTRATVRCGVAAMNVHQGNIDVTQMIFDTESILIKGDGHIELDQEKIDLDIAGHSKHLRIGRLRSPITVNGTLRKPTVGIDAGDATKQIGIAAILGALFSPLTAALAFIDPGLAKDANCAALLAEAKRELDVQAQLERPVADLALRHHGAIDNLAR